MEITKDTYIKLVRFDVTKEHQLTFENITAQTNFFITTLNGVELQASSYQRKDFKVRFPAGIDAIEKYNYMVCRNLPYNFKYYYFYITNMEYVNDELTDVFIQLDVFQTYQFDFIYKRSMVEREHVNSDIAGENTVPEGLETGEYYVNTYEYCDLFDSNCIVVTASKPVNATSNFPNDVGHPVSSLNGVWTYGKVYICESATDIRSLLSGFSNNQYSGGTESITNMYFVPRKCINWDNVVELPLPDIIKEYSSNSPMIYDFTISKPSSLDGYVPKNKKLLTFPYCFLVASNNNGSNNVYYYEKFNSSSCEFDFSCIPTPRCVN